MTWLRLFAIAALCSACIEDHLVRCPDGNACAPTQACSPRGGCVEKDQIEQCIAPPASGECVLTGGGAGGCVDGVCVPRGCGNGMIEATEACDDGNRLGGDGCNATCTSDETCGNAYLDSSLGEGCDCGAQSFTGQRPEYCNGASNSDDPSAPCTPQCLLRGCGDGQRGGLEDCDGADQALTACTAIGFYGGSLGCLSTCRYDVSGCSGRCGDGVRNGPPAGSLEACDGTDLAGMDCTDLGFYYPAGLGCNALCGIDVSACTGSCNDGAFDTGHELCDPSESSADLAARGLDCTDFGFYAAPGLACATSCQFDTSGCGGGYCGDGIKQAQEECDTSDVGTTTCTDFGFYVSSAPACRRNCTIDVSVCTGGRCGDNVINGPEQCDGSVPAGTDCTDLGFYSGSGLMCTACRLDTANCVGRCGDGIRNGPEQCDNAQLGGANCTQFGYYAPQGLSCSAGCTYSTASCTGGVCGDGAINGPEECDGASLDNRNCRDFGFYKPEALGCGSTCGYDTSGCSEICGDDLVNGPESCDGAPAPNPSCTSVGWDAGELGCASSCTDAFQHCRKYGYEVEVIANAIWRDVWGSGDEGFAVSVGPPYVARRQQNGTWTAMTSSISSNLYAVWGSSTADVFAVGDKLNATTWTIWRYDGLSWTAMSGPAGTAENLKDVWGTGPNDVWAVGLNGTVLHYTAGVWSKVTTPIPGTTNMMSVWGIGSHVFVGGTSGTVYHWTGASWQDVSLGNTEWAMSISGRAADDVYTIGFGGTVYHFDGVTWLSLGKCTPFIQGDSILVDASTVLVTGAVSAYVGGVCQLGGGLWNRLDAGELGVMYGLWSASSRIYGVGFGTAITLSGASTITPPSPGGQATSALWGTAANALYAAGGSSGADTGAILYYSGLGWSSVTMPSSPAPRFLRSIYGEKTWAVAVGNGGTIIGGNGTTGSAFSNHTSGTTKTLRGVWGDSAYVHAVGDNGTTLELVNGLTTWSTLPPVTLNNLNAVWGAASGNVFAVGDGGTILTHQGGSLSWTPMASGTLEDLLGVWGRSKADVYAVGKHGTVLHYDGTNWAAVPYANGSDDLHNIWGTTGDLFVTSGTALRQLAGGRWVDVRLPIPGLSSLQAWGLSDLSLVIGANGAGTYTIFGIAGRFFRPAASETVCDDFWDDDDDGFADCADTDCASAPACTNGGACQPLVDLSCGQSVSGTTEGGGTRWAYYGAGCSPRDERGRERFYRVQRPTSGSITVSISPSTPTDFDLIVSSSTATGACTPDMQCLAADQTATPNPTVTFSAGAAKSYIVAVDGYAGATGAYFIMVTCP